MLKSSMLKIAQYDSLLSLLFATGHIGHVI